MIKFRPVPGVCRDFFFSKATTLRQSSVLTACLVALTGMSAIQANADDAPQAALQAHLTFSIDGGANFSDAPPKIPAPQLVYVKADWTVSEPRPIKDNLVFTNLWSKESDFASANVGKQNWTGTPAWHQRIEKPFFNVQVDLTTTYILDLKARADGVMGNANTWDKNQSKYVSGPLPACPALGPGPHNFNFHLNYRLADGSAAPTLDLPFVVTIAGGPDAPAPATPTGATTPTGAAATMALETTAAPTPPAQAPAGPLAVDLLFGKAPWSPTPKVPSMNWDSGYLFVTAKWASTYTEKDDVRYEAWIESATTDWASANTLKSGEGKWRQKLWLPPQRAGGMKGINFKMTFDYRQPGLSSAPIVAQDGSTTYDTLPTALPLAPGVYPFTCVITRTVGGKTETASKDFSVTIGGSVQSVILSGISDNQVYQRGSAKTGDITFWLGGDNSAKKTVDVVIKKDGAADITKQLAVTKADQEIVVPDVPVGGPYNVQLKCNDATKSFSNILVGDIWIISGQSNAVGCGGDLSFARKAIPGVNGLSPRYGLLEWMPAADGFFESTVGPWVAAAQDYYKSTGVPVGLMGHAVGARGIDFFMDGAHTEMPFLKPMVERYGRHARMFLWYQGESDSFALGEETYGPKLKKMAAAMRKYTENPDLPMGIVQLSKYMWYKDDHFSQIREAQRQFVLQDPKAVLYSTAPYELNKGDKIHLLSKSYIDLGVQIANQMAQAEQTGVVSTPGPMVQSVGFANPDHKEVTVKFANGDGLAGGDDVNEWYVTDATHGGFAGGGFVPISGVKVDAQGGTVTLDLSEPPGASPAVSYAYRCDLMGTLRNAKNFYAPAFVKAAIESK